MLPNTQYPIPNTHPTVNRQPSLLRRVWRRGIGVWARLIGRRRYDRLVIEQLGAQPIIVLPQVFNPVLLRSGAFLALSLDAHRIPPGASVLDMGTGSGAGALCAARLARRVLAVDINPAAVRCARINVLLHQLEGVVEVRQGDLFAPIAGEQFDVVLFNPPYFRGTARDDLDRAWRSEDVVERFAAGLRAHLKPGGSALVVLSTDGDTTAFLAAFRANGFVVEVAAQRDVIDEVMTIYRLTPL